MPNGLHCDGRYMAKILEECVCPHLANERWSNEVVASHGSQHCHNGPLLESRTQVTYCEFSGLIKSLLI